jgi:hypothetical protein
MFLSPPFSRSVNSLGGESCIAVFQCTPLILQLEDMAQQHFTRGKL